MTPPASTNPNAPTSAGTEFDPLEREWLMFEQAVADEAAAVAGLARAIGPEWHEAVALIERWGGEVIDDITGDLDFLVLGERPDAPLQPAPNAPRVVYDEYLRLKNRVDRYEELFEAASASSIPVLNQNRLRTLIGELPR